METTHFRIPHLKGRELPLEKDWGVYDAEWIALVCLHSGVFTREQYRAYFDATFMRARCFVQRLVDRKVAVEEKLPVLWGRPGWICRISHKGIYRALGVPDIRHRRKADAATTYRRLISLDYVIQNMGHQWLPTEAEKLAAFVGSMGVDRAQLPQRIYGGALANRRAYFPIKMPIALLPEIPAYEFVYIDQGDTTGEAVRSWGREHADLWRALGQKNIQVRVAAASPDVRSEERTRRIIEGWAGTENGAKRPVRIDSFRIWRSHRISDWEAV